MKLSEIRASYTSEKREDAKKDPWAHYVARPLSFYPAWLCIKLRISATTVTIVGILVGLAGCAAMLPGYLILGSVLVNLSGLLDYVDGDIARATGTQSEYGGRLDGFGYLAITAGLFISVGIGSGVQHLIVLGVLASFTRIFRYAISYQAGLPVEIGKPSIPVRIGMAVIGAREPLLLICALTGYLNYFIYFYAVVNFGEMMVIVNRVLRRD